MKRYSRRAFLTGLPRPVITRVSAQRALHPTPLNQPVMIEQQDIAMTWFPAHRIPAIRDIRAVVRGA